jgi:hypothetical protein
MLGFIFLVAFVLCKMQRLPTVHQAVVVGSLGGGCWEELNISSRRLQARIPSRAACFSR